MAGLSDGPPGPLPPQRRPKKRRRKDEDEEEHRDEGGPTAKVFSKIDIIAAFNKLRIAEGEEWKTAFRIRYGKEGKEENRDPPLGHRSGNDDRMVDRERPHQLRNTDTPTTWAKARSERDPTHDLMRTASVDAEGKVNASGSASIKTRPRFDEKTASQVAFLRATTAPTATLMDDT